MNNRSVNTVKNVSNGSICKRFQFLSPLRQRAVMASKDKLRLQSNSACEITALNDSKHINSVQLRKSSSQQLLKTPRSYRSHSNSPRRSKSPSIHPRRPKSPSNLPIRSQNHSSLPRRSESPSSPPKIPQSPSYIPIRSQNHSNLPRRSTSPSNIPRISRSPPNLISRRKSPSTLPIRIKSPPNAPRRPNTFSNLPKRIGSCAPIVNTRIRAPKYIGNTRNIWQLSRLSTKTHLMRLEKNKTVYGDLAHKDINALYSPPCKRVPEKAALTCRPKCKIKSRSASPRRRLSAPRKTTENYRRSPKPKKDTKNDRISPKPKKATENNKLSTIKEPELNNDERGKEEGEEEEDSNEDFQSAQDHISTSHEQNQLTISASRSETSAVSQQTERCLGIKDYCMKPEHKNPVKDLDHWEESQPIRPKSLPNKFISSFPKKKEARVETQPDIFSHFWSSPIALIGNSTLKLSQRLIDRASLQPTDIQLHTVEVMGRMKITPMHSHRDSHPWQQNGPVSNYPTGSIEINSKRSPNKFLKMPQTAKMKF